MKKLFLSGVSINLVVIIINVATGVIAARLLGPFNRGILAEANRWAGLTTVLLTFGLPGAVIYLSKTSTEQKERLFGAYLILGSLFGIFGVAIGEFLIPHFLRNIQGNMSVVRILLLSVLFGVLSDGLVGTLQVFNRFRKVLILRILFPVSNLATMGILWFIHHFTIQIYAICIIILGVLVFALELLWALFDVQPSFIRIKHSSSLLLRKGVQIYASSIVNIMGFNIDQLLLSLFLSPAALGIYTVAGSIANMLPTLIIGATNVFLWPRLMDLSQESREYTVSKIHSALFYGSFLMTILAASLLPTVLPFVYGARYESAILIGQVLLITGPLSVGYSILVSYLSTVNKFNQISIAELLGLSFGMLGMFMLMPHLKGIGAACGMDIAYLTKWIYAMFVYKKQGGSPMRMLVPKWNQLKGLFATRI